MQLNVSSYCYLDGGVSCGVETLLSEPFRYKTMSNFNVLPYLQVLFTQLSPKSSIVCPFSSKVNALILVSFWATFTVLIASSCKENQLKSKL